MKDYYKILELDKDVTQEQINAQHKLLLHAWHPDKFPEGDLKKKANEKTLEINEAYSILGNQSKRYSYDQEYEKQFRSTYATNNTYQSEKDKDNRNANSKRSNAPNPNPTKNAAEPSPKKQRNKNGAFVWFGFLILLCVASSLFINSPQSQDTKQQTFTSTKALAQNQFSTSTPTSNSLISPRKNCYQWADIDSSLIGETICVFGEVVTFTPKEEVRVPEIGTEWRWYYYFSFENNDFFLSQYSADFDFQFYGGCIEVRGELKSYKPTELYLDILPNNWELLNDC